MKEVNIDLLEKLNFKQTIFSYLGKVKDYYFEIVEQEDAILAISFSYFQNDAKAKMFEYFDEIQKNGVIKQYEVNKDRITVFYNENSDETLEKFFDNLTLQFSSIEMKNKCFICDNTADLSFYTLGLKYSLLCKTCADSAIAKLQDSKNTKNNYLLGFLGSVLGALVGSVLWIIIGLLGFIASIAGAAISYCAFKGYSLFKGKLTKKGIVLNIVAIIIAFIFAQYIGLYFDFKEAIAGADFGLYLMFTPVLFSDSEFLLGLLPNLGLGILFIALGASTSISNNFKAAKNNEELKIEKIDL